MWNRCCGVWQGTRIDGIFWGGLMLFDEDSRNSRFAASSSTGRELPIRTGARQIFPIFRDPVVPRTLTSELMSRTYVPHQEKHKWPKGYGSLCPRMPAADPQMLLEKAVAVEGVGTNKLWVAQGRWCFCAHPSPHAGPDAWHGFPVIGGDLDERVLIRLFRDGFITRREMKQLRAQRTLPEAWP